MERQQIDSAEFERVLKSSISIMEAAKTLRLPETMVYSLARLLGIKSTKTRIVLGGNGRAYTADDVRSIYLSNTLAITSCSLRHLLLSTGIKEARCESCGLTEWLGYPIPLELHHRNNDHFDNTEANLMLVCPSCHRIITNRDHFERALQKKRLKEEKARIKEERDRNGWKPEDIPGTKFNCTAEELLGLMNKYKSYTKVGEYFGVSDKAVAKRCKRLGILAQVQPIIETYRISLAKQNRKGLTQAVVDRCVKNYILKHPDSKAAKAVDCMDIQTGDIVKTYQNPHEAKLAGFTPSRIHECCMGIRHTHKGFRWRYHNAL